MSKTKTLTGPRPKISTELVERLLLPSWQVRMLWQLKLSIISRTFLACSALLQIWVIVVAPCHSNKDWLSSGNSVRTFCSSGVSIVFIENVIQFVCSVCNSLLFTLLWACSGYRDIRLSTVSLEAIYLFYTSFFTYFFSLVLPVDSTRTPVCSLREDTSSFSYSILETIRLWWSII